VYSPVILEPSPPPIPYYPPVYHPPSYHNPPYPDRSMHVSNQSASQYVNQSTINRERQTARTPNRRGRGSNLRSPSAPRIGDCDPVLCIKASTDPQSLTKCDQQLIKQMI
jgi:hypothetical protein